MWFKFLEKFGSRPGLERITKILEAFGNPQNKMKIIVVSGTNGKGSTTAFLSSILKENGWKTGSFFSPHLLKFNERIRINGKTISDLELKTLEKRIKNWVDEGNTLTYFEAIVACAYTYFADKGVEYAVMETGMGGRLDAVNVIPKELAIISSIGLEHTKWLGNTLEQIAYEKCGIIDGAKLVITGATKGLETIKREARKRGSNLLTYGEDFEGEILTENIYRTHFRYSNSTQFDELEINLAGEFQLKNACLAIAGAENLGCSALAIKTGLKKAKIRGRMEVLSEKPFILVDVAHNPAGIRALVSSLEKLEKRNIVCIFCAMQDKNWKEMIKELGTIVKNFVVFTPNKNKRAEKCGNLLKEAKRYVKSYSVKNSGEALELAKKLAQKEQGIILITGSIYIMEEIYETLNKK